MPDQAPPSPAGCVYGPWQLDDGWYAALIAVTDADSGVSYWDPESHTWGSPNAEEEELTDTASELLRLAKENAEMLLLIRRWLHSHTAPDIAPVEEWKKDAMICLQEKEG